MARKSSEPISTYLTASDLSNQTIRRGLASDHIQPMDSLTIANSYECRSHAASSRPSSAIAAFYALLSPTNSKQNSLEPSSVTTPVVRPTSKPKSSSVGLGALPTEILLLIFQLVFDACIDWVKTGAFYPNPMTVWLDDDPLSPSLFPYSMAAVCSRWFHILSSVAVYWTRQIITVNFDATSLISMQTPLHWVKDLPLQLIVVRHPGVSAKTIRDKHPRVCAILHLLEPHIHRTWSLTFDGRCSSAMPELRSSQLGASFPPGPPRHPARNSDGYNSSLQIRFLEDVTLGGHIFDSIQEFGDHHKFWFSNVTSLTIRGYTTSYGNGISLLQFITTIQTCWSLQKLTVEDVAFTNDVRASQRFHLVAPVVCLHNITGRDALGSIISQSFGSRSKEVITISNCPFEGFGKRSSFRARISSVNLVLEGMNASSTAIRQLVCFWNGENLSLINCPGVSLSFLRGVPTKDTPPDLRRLQIVDCENAVVEDLMALVKSREIQSAIDSVLLAGDPDEESCTALTELCVRGRGPCINTEQATWLADHVDSFFWDAMASDGMRYTWDTAARELIVVPMQD